MLAGYEPPPADLDGGQVAAAHLVVEQVAGQAGQAGGLIDGVGQPPAVRILAGGRGVVVAERRRIRDARGHIGRFRFPVVVPTGLSCHCGRVGGEGCRAGRPG